MRLTSLIYTIFALLTVAALASCGRNDINPVDPRGYFMYALVDGQPWITTRNYKFPRTSFMRDIPYKGLVLYGEDKNDTSTIEVVIKKAQGIPETFTIAEGDSTAVYASFKANRFGNTPMPCKSGTVVITDIRRYSNGVVDMVGTFELSFGDSTGSVSATTGQFRLPLE
ncbi:MAG: hypothetical protein EAZ57_02865 [Cytophagales bacterium]|nr:MAG: hypothetical protein EAZ67_03330 [Cytophagales bacterium]TAF61700.1 MAG: hypothetical protein EAZ57_02865 [Cytophagales bacterium]